MNQIRNYLLGKDQLVRSYQEQGFSKSEAEKLTYLGLHRQEGRFYGIIIIGGALTFTMHKNQERIFRFNKKLQILMRNRTYYSLYLLSGLIGGYFIGDYLTINKRYGANSLVANLYNNNNFITNKEKFLQNYTTMNRKFTKLEIECFMENIKLRSKERDQSLKRKYIYNPHIHGDQESFNKMVQDYLQDNIDPKKRPGFMEQVKSDNQNKIQNNEEIVIEAMEIDNIIDPTGIKHGIQFNSWIKGWNLKG